MDTLVLSSVYQPMVQVGWEKAMSMYITGRVEIIEEYHDRFVRTVNTIFKMPSVVRFVGTVVEKYRNIRGVRFSRKNLFLRDKGRCQYCNKNLMYESFTIDHVIPASRGGKKTWENVVAACSSCNQKKRNRTPDEAGMFIHKKPKIPRFLPTRLRIRKSVPESWKFYLEKKR